MYGYLKADVKAIVNDIIDELAKEERVQNAIRHGKKAGRRYSITIKIRK